MFTPALTLGVESDRLFGCIFKGFHQRNNSLNYVDILVNKNPVPLCMFFHVCRMLYSVVSLEICSITLSQLSTSIISTFIMDDCVNAVKQQP